MKDITEKEITGLPGVFGLFLLVVLVSLSGITAYHVFSSFPQNFSIFGAGFALVCTILFFASLSGLSVVNPNSSRVFMFMGQYKGTLREHGFWLLPFWWGETEVVTRTNTLETGAIKVNDKAGNPIEIGAVLLWHVSDPARALLCVDDYEALLKQQAETALRSVAAKYKYDAGVHTGESVTEKPTTEEHSLREHQVEVSKSLKELLNASVDRAGVEVVDVKLTHLAYSPEIAQAMLMRQQAEAMVAARRTLVQGVTGIVADTIKTLRDSNLNLDEDRQASMAANLMIVLVSERSTTPVVNVGSLT